MKDALIPQLKKRRNAYHYPGPALLLLGRCSAHFGPEVSEFLNQNSLHLLYIPPISHMIHTWVPTATFVTFSSVFGCFSFWDHNKRLMANSNRTENVNIKTSHMIQFISGFFAAAVPTSVIRSFRNAEISLCRDGQEIRWLTTPGTVRHFDA
jgi:hypothetical protein